jgi:hypothetical protein
MTVSGSPRYFTYFVTDNAAVMASQAYLAQANQPSAWTRQVLPYFRNTNRTACHVVRRIGRCKHTVLILESRRPSVAPDAAFL